MRVSRASCNPACLCSLDIRNAAAAACPTLRVCSLALQLVRLVMDNTGGELLSDLNQGMFPPFAKYTDRQDIIRYGQKICGT